MPDCVHVLTDGRIASSGGKELALELEEKGYGWLEQSRSAAGRAERWFLSIRARPPPPARPFLAEFEARRTAGQQARVAAQEREAAMAAFAAQGFPTTRDEEWRFTTVTPIADTAFVPAELLHVPPPT